MFTRFNSWQSTIDKLQNGYEVVFDLTDMRTILERKLFIDAVQMQHPKLLQENTSIQLLSADPFLVDGLVCSDAKLLNQIFEGIHLTEKEIIKHKYFIEILNLFYQSNYTTYSYLGTMITLFNFATANFPAHAFLAKSINVNTKSIFIKKDHLLIGKMFRKDYCVFAISLGTLMKDTILLTKLEPFSTLPELVDFNHPMSKYRHSALTSSISMPHEHLRVKLSEMKYTKVRFGNPCEEMSNYTWQTLMRV